MATKLLTAFFLCSILAVGNATPAAAQVTGGASPSLIDQASTNPLLLLRQRLSQGSMAASAVPLEGAVDPDAYIVGPGDMFSVSVAGQEITAAPVPVGVDGRIVLPDAGAVMIGGLSLTQSRKEMFRALNRSFGDAVVEVALVQSRQFYVHVAGAVPNPGRFLALPVARVSSVLEFAFADTSSASVSASAFRPSLRNIVLQHTDGTTTPVDLVRYFTAGHPDSNPYLRDGDVISVPAYDPTFSSVSVGGYVPFPGSYDFKPGDSLYDLIQMAGGLPESKNVDHVRLMRMKQGAEGGIETITFTKDDVGGERGRAFILQALDVISVSQTDDRYGLVHVEGQVRFPGSYPIIAGKTTVREVVEAAGGPRIDALMRGAFVERRSLPDPMQRQGIDRFQGGQSDVLRRILSSDSTAILQQMRLTDIGFLSRAYFALELRLQNRVSINLEEQLAGNGPVVYLEPNDRIVIPEDKQSVFVVGQIHQPGYVPVQPGMSTEFYIAAAGGRSQTGDKVYVVNPATGSYKDSKTAQVFSGDVIFVDRENAIADNADLQRLIIEDKRLVIEENRIRSDARSRTLQTVLQSVGTLASVVALIISLRR